MRVKSGKQLKAGKAGHFFTPGSVESLVDNLQQLLGQSGMEKDLLKDETAHHLPKFNYKKQVEKLTALLKGGNQVGPKQATN